MTVWIAHRRIGPRADRYFVGGASNATIVGDAPARVENTASCRGELAFAEEALGASTVDRLAWVEFSSAVSRDAGLPEELGASQFAALWLPFEAIGSITLLRADQSGTLEWSRSLQREDFVCEEALRALALDLEIQFECLTAGAILIQDAGSPIEAEAATPAVLISVESLPEGGRVLATPGRVRLLRRQ